MYSELLCPATFSPPVEKKIKQSVQYCSHSNILTLVLSVIKSFDLKPSKASPSISKCWIIELKRSAENNNLLLSVQDQSTNQELLYEKVSEIFPRKSYHIGDVDGPMLPI